MLKFCKHGNVCADAPRCTECLWEALAEIKKLLSSTCCVWEYTHDACLGIPNYNTACGMIGSRKAGNFCPYCGKPILLENKPE